MSIQTEIKNEKALFTELIKKIKNSKTFEVAGVTDKSKAETYKFDTFDITMFFDEIAQPNGLREKYGDDDGFYIIGAPLDFVSKIIVSNKKGKSIMERDCRPLDVEGDALAIQKVRYQMAKKIMNTIDERKEELEEKQKKLEEEKKRASILKASKVLRKKQQAEAVIAKKTLEAIKSL